jgi:hypothetical protein
MKLTSPMIAAISIAVLLCLFQVYVDIEWFSSSGDLARLKSANAAATSQLASLQGSVDGFKQSLKQYDAAIGDHGSIQLLAKAISAGEFDLTVKSLKVVANGKTVVSVGSLPDVGGQIQVVSNDGTSSAEILSAPGKSKLGFKATSGSDAAVAVHLATYGSDGLYLQKGATEDVAARTDGAGLQILDSGSNFFMSQSNGGNVSIDTTTGDERGLLSLWSDGSPKKIIKLSLGSKDGSPFESLSGAGSGYLMTLVPDRLSLATKDGNPALSVAGDDGGGFVIVNDKGGERRAIMASGTDGHGTIGVFGNDGRSNTLFPEYNIQKTGSSQK